MPPSARKSASHTVALLVLLSFALTACQGPAALAFDGVVIALKPGLPAIEKPGVPALHERTVAADDTQRVSFSAENNLWIAIRESSVKHDRLVGHLKADASVDRVVLTAWDWDNRPVQQWSRAAPIDQQFRFDIEGRGVYLITADGMKADKCGYREVRSVGLIDSASGRSGSWADSNFFLGVCAFPGRYHWKPGGVPAMPPAFDEAGAVQAEALFMEHLGLSTVRLDVSMVLPEKPDATIDWKRMDAAVEAYTRRRFKLGLQLMHPPDWAIDPQYAAETSDRWRFPRREEPYRRYVREIVSRYGKDAQFVQVYNEPDQVEFWAASPEEYIREFQWAKDESRKVSPKMPITNGGYAFIDPSRTEHYVKALRGKTDLQAYHSHGNLRELVRDVDHMRKVHREAGYEKPRFINTECGYAVWRLDQERAQAVAVLQKILYSWAHGDEGMLLFCSRMTKGSGPGSRTDRDFGLLDAHFCPRFAYGAVAAFADTFAGATFERTLVESENLHVYSFKRGEERLVVAFTTGLSESVTIESDATMATVVDAMGNRTNEKTPGAVKITIGAYPRTIALTGATRVKVAE